MGELNFIENIANSERDETSNSINDKDGNDSYITKKVKDDEKKTFEDDET